MRKPVEDETVVDLVGENDEAVPPRDIGDPKEQILRIDRAGRIVRVDDDDRLRAVRDLRLDIVKIRIPVRRLVAEVMHDRAAGQRRAGRPERIIGRRDKDLVPGIEQRVHGQLDQFRHAVAGIDIVHTDVRQALDLRILHDGLTGRPDPFRVGVSLRIPEIGRHIHDHLEGRPETEGRRIADVEFRDRLPGRLHTGRLVDDRTADIVKYVFEFR